MDYFADLDISMEETHVCVVDRDGAVVYEARTASTPEAITASLAQSPVCRRGAKGKGDEEKASGPRKMELSLNVGVQFGLTLGAP